MEDCFALLFLQDKNIRQAIPVLKVTQASDSDPLKRGVWIW